MSTNSLVRRKCNSNKSCTDCAVKIKIGEEYFGGSYKSLCIPCGEKEETLTKEEVLGEKPVKNTGYVGKKCEFCGDDSRGIIDGHVICPKPDCIDKAFGIHNEVK